MWKAASRAAAVSRALALSLGFVVLGCEIRDDGKPSATPSLEASANPSPSRDDPSEPLLCALETQTHTLGRIEATLTAIHGELRTIRELETAHAAAGEEGVAEVSPNESASDALSELIRFHRRRLETDFLITQADALLPPPPGDPIPFCATADRIREMLGALSSVTSLDDLAGWMAQYNQR